MIHRFGKLRMKRGAGRTYVSSFQVKLLLSYVIIILIPVLSAFLIFGFQLYNQTRASYEKILHQFSDRASTTVDDFFANITRNTFFYITNNSLTKIIEKPGAANELEFYEDFLTMRKAMDQIVLMNGSIAGVTLSALNRTVYSSTAAYDSNLERLVRQVPQSELHKGKAVATSPYEDQDSPNKLVSILRYLSDLDTTPVRKSGYVKVDVKFQTIEQMLGGLSTSNTEIGTMVIAPRGNQAELIYLTKHAPAGHRELLSRWTELIGASDMENEPIRLHLGGDSYAVAVSRIESTGWLMAHYIPESVIRTAFQRSISNYAIISAAVLLIALMLAVGFSKYFFQPIHRVRTAMKLVDTGTLEQIVKDDGRKDELGQLVRGYNAMIRRLVASREREQTANRLQRRAELNRLQAQINPHFLYNTLNIISSIAELHRVGEISAMSRSLASLYRYNLKSKEIVTIASELEQLRHYIGIQQIRFFDKVKVNYDIDESLLQCRIPKFLIQPVVENSFQHGLETKEDEGTLTLSIRRMNHSIRIQITDDGIGMDQRQVRSLNEALAGWELEQTEPDTTSIGLGNVGARIKYMYGSSYGLQVSSKLHEGTRVTMTIPAEEEETAT